MANLWDTAACMELDRFLAARGIRYTPPTLGTTLGSPPGPPGHGHATGSNHYPSWWGGPPGSTGQARDYGTYGSDCQAIADALEPFAQGPNYVISELIWTRRLPRTGTYYKRGIAYTPSFTLAWQHNNHVHAAIAVGRHLPGVPPPPPPKPEEGFLMALTPEQQQQMYGRLMALTTEQQQQMFNRVQDLQEKANFEPEHTGGRHPTWADIVNKVVENVNAHTDAKIAEAVAALKP